jgi:Tfp pilus assembly protein PilX
VRTIAGRRRAKGAVLLTVALVLVLVMAGLALVDGALLARARATRDESRRVELQALADAAMAEALANLAHDRHHRGVRPHAFARGAISSRIEPAGTDRFRVEAVAELAQNRQTIVAEVSLFLGRPAVVAWQSRRGGG